jgi:hypothetical protein
VSKATGQSLRIKVLLLGAVRCAGKLNLFKDEYAISMRFFRQKWLKTLMDIA